jgi:hypothetical protein
MKKITTYFFVSLLAISSAVIATPFGKNNSGSRHGNPTPTTQSVPFYMEDFASGIPATWQNNDLAGQGVFWRPTLVGSTALSFGNLSATGTSAANGYVIFDSDSAWPSAGDGELISDAIDCSAHTNVHLTLNEFFVQWSVSQGIVWVSNDGTTWNDVYHAEAGLAGNTAGVNPNAVDIDITTWAAGMATVYIKLEYIGTSEFIWEVDDIGLYEVAAADGGVTDITSPVSSCTALTNAEPVTVVIKNFSAFPLTDFDVTFSDGISNPVEHITDTIAPGGSLTYTFTATADMSAVGAHNVLASTTVLNDADNANDQFSIDLFSGPHIVDQSTSYSQGFEDIEDQSGWTAVDADNDSTMWGVTNVAAHTGTNCATYTHNLPTNQADDFYFSTCLSFSDSNVYQLDFYYRTFSPQFQANMEVILCTAQDPLTKVATIVPSMLVTNSNWAFSSSSVFIPNGVSGIYYIGWHVTQQDSSTSLKIDDINIHYSGPNSISKSGNTSLSLYPNPGDGLLHVSGLKELTEITVYDVVGKAVFIKTSASANEVLDLRNQPKGVYSVVLRTENSSVTKQLILTGN